MKTPSALLESTHSLISRIEPRFDAAANDIAEIVQTARSQAGKLDLTVNDLQERLFRQTVRIDGMATSVLDFVENIGEYVSETISRPQRRISSVLAAAKAFVKGYAAPVHGHATHAEPIPTPEDKKHSCLNAPRCLYLPFSRCLLSPPRSPPRLLVLSKSDHTLAIVDPASFKVEAKIPSGDDPHEVAASTDGRTTYISNYGFGAFHTITAVDILAHKQSKVIDLTPLRGPHGLQFAEGKLWFTRGGQQSHRQLRSRHRQGRLDSRHRPEPHAHASRLPRRAPHRHHECELRHVFNSRPHRNAQHPTRRSAPWERHHPGGYHPILPPGGGLGHDGAAAGQGGEGFDVSPDGKQAWIANAADGTVTILDLEAKKVAATLYVNVKTANRLKFTPDGKHVLISMLAQPDVLVLDAATYAPTPVIVKRIPIGHGAAGILMQPDGARAYVACTPDSYVAVIDLKTLEVVGHIEAGGNPDGMAWAVIP